MGLVVKAQHRGQDLMLSNSEHRSQRGGVFVVRVEQRQAGEVCTSRDVALASSGLESCAKGNKRCLSFLVGGGHNVL